MVISIVTLFPELFKSFFETSLIKRALDQGLIRVNIYNLLDAVAPKVRVDAHTVGPGPGMLIKPEAIETGILACQTMYGPSFNIFFTPQGIKLDQIVLRQIQKLGFDQFMDQRAFGTTLSNESNAVVDYMRSDFHLVLVCSRYEGVDERVFQRFSDLNLSIGDYVLLGGELPAQVFLESFLRLLPQVVGNQASVKHESFETPFFDHPEYSKPDEWHGLSIPSVLLSGNHQKINDWRQLEAIKKTVLNRFDWVRSHPDLPLFLSAVRQVVPNHYCVIMHDQVLNKEGVVGTTSVKSIDLHDISRSASTYGFKQFFVVQPLKDQQAIVKEFFSFWTEGGGKGYNETRCEAVEKLGVFDSLDQVIKEIEILESGKKPLLIGTSAKKHSGKLVLGYNDQGYVWQYDRPVLLILGTGYGLADSVIELVDYLLEPVRGFVEYNHLSVRAAASIIFDRWLGIK